MKIIFLDIDGVLNTYGEDGSLASWEHCKSELMHNLEKIVKETDAYIVISSSWREEGIELLKESGFQYVDRIIGVTPHWIQGFYIEHRGEQIMGYVRQNGIHQYIVIDDEPFDICGERCNVISKDKVVITNHTEGLTEEKANEAIRKLNAQADRNRAKI